MITPFGKQASCDGQKLRRALVAEPLGTGHPSIHRLRRRCANRTQSFPDIRVDSATASAAVDPDWVSGSLFTTARMLPALCRLSLLLSQIFVPGRMLLRVPHKVIE